MLSSINFSSGAALLSLLAALSAPTAAQGPAAAPAPAKDCGSGSAYSVISGDTCIGIALKTGTTHQALRSANDIPEACNNLLPGDVLCIPKTCRTTIVQPGTSCLRLSQQSGLNLTDFLAFNPSIDPACKNLIAGTNVCISSPNGTAQTEPSPVPLKAESPVPTGSIAPRRARGLGRVPV
ncbi:MAG: hypothetical protein M1832_004114 [Thelocarpon impressellum]|nr:MAG: hypothetical protein M1832_004114 [Thelocarpon impressellum]